MRKSSQSAQPFWTKKILRSAWPLWTICILFGILAGPICAGIVTPLFQKIIVDVEITENFVRTLMIITGIIIGIITSYNAEFSYITATKGLPWLLLGLAVPIATLALAALFALSLVIIGKFIFVLCIIALIILFCFGFFKSDQI